VKELIGKLSRGTIEYNVPKMDIRAIDIDISMAKGDVYRGSFEINGEGDTELKGVLYSSDSVLKIENDKFVGRYNTINYVVDGKYFYGGENIKGEIRVVSNGGEAVIPFNITVTSESLDYEDKKITNMASFVSFAKENWDIAVRMFGSDKFSKVILGKDIDLRTLRKGVLLSGNGDIALEEFLNTTGRKDIVKISLSESKKEYVSSAEVDSDTIILTKSTWGYADVKVEVDGEFIEGYKTRISNEDFIANKYEFKYLINKNKLHAGSNMGRITFITPYEKSICDITAINGEKVEAKVIDIDKDVAELNERYLQLRFGDITVDRWAEESLEIIDKIRSIDDTRVFFKLFQAQIYLTKGRDEEAEWLLENVADEVLDNKDEDVVIYCYYLYVRTLQRRELEQTLKTIEIVRKYYENGYDTWELLWILLYLDTSYENNKSLKLARIKEQFNIGCRSSLMYYEAGHVFNKQPVLLRVINKFELQVLNFISKHGVIEKRLANQIAEIAVHEKEFRPLLFNILVKLYDRYETDNILQAIVMVLICGDKRNEKYFKYYKLAVDREIEVTRIYEYYVLSMPKDYNLEINNNVYMYFMYNGDNLGDKAGFFYSLIVRNKESNVNVYNNYKMNLERFAIDKIGKGEVDEYISVVYHDVLQSSMIRMEDMAGIEKILNTWKITCKSENMRSVIVRYKEISGEREFILKNNVCYPDIYTRGAVILFRSLDGQIYHNSVDYDMEKMYSDESVSELVSKWDKSPFIIAGECERILKEKKVNTLREVEVLREVENGGEFRRDFRTSVTEYIVDYYHNHYDGEDIVDYLKSIDYLELSKQGRIKLIEVMITVGMYNYAGGIMEKCGFKGVDTRKIFKYCIKMLKTARGKEEDRFLIDVCKYSFYDGKYNDGMLDYLCRYFNGTTEEMLDLWKKAGEFSYESKELEERIIAQILFTGGDVDTLVTVYDSYCKKGGPEMIRYAYMFYVSYQYFIKEKKVKEEYFKHLTDELINDFKLMDMCKCAFLLYYSDKKDLSLKVRELAEVCVEYLEKKKLIFDYYKKYSKYFKISAAIADKTTVCYKCEPKDKVLINYYISDGDVGSGSNDNNGVRKGNGSDNIDNDSNDIIDEEREYETLEMNKYFYGMYVKSFTLFHGEKLNYYITEIKDGKMTFSDQMSYNPDNTGEEMSNSKYGMINRVIVSVAEGRYTDVATSGEKLYLENKMIDKFF